MKPLMLVVGVTSALAAGCGIDAGPPPAIVEATVDGHPWRAPWGSGFIVPAPDGPTAFSVMAGSLVPGSDLVDASKPQLFIVFPTGVPSPGSYVVSDQVTLNGTYQTDVNTSYGLTSGTVEIDSISPTRARGSFNLQAEIPYPTEITVMIADGTFDVPVAGP